MELATNTPRVTIGMPVYNAEQYIEETIESVLAQTYGDFVLYIADNASTDKTEVICRQFCKRDPRIVYIRNPSNVGAAKNYEVCYAPAQSEFYRWQNADDPIEPRLIEACIEALDTQPDAVLAYGTANIIDAHGHLINEHRDNLTVDQSSAADRMIACIGSIGIQNQMYGLIRREALAKTARMRSYVAADLNLITELSLYGKFILLSEHLFNRRMHPECSSWDRKDSDRQKNFWDPTKRKLVLQTWRSTYEYYKAVTRSPAPIKEKWSLYKYLLRFTYWRKDLMSHELNDFLKFGILRLKP